MDADVRFGKPCLTGTRIDVATIVGTIAAGDSVETVASEYAVSVDHVRSALAYAAHIAAHQPPAVRHAPFFLMRTAGPAPPTSAFLHRALAFAHSPSLKMCRALPIRNRIAHSA